MPMYGAFYPESVRTITEALDFVMKKVSEFFEMKKGTVDKSHHNLIDIECQKELQQLDQVKSFLKEYMNRVFYQLDEQTNEYFMNIIRSALEVYLQDTLKARAETGLPGFDAKIEAIRHITNLDGLKNRKTDLFDKYYEAPKRGPEGRRVEIFFSYATRDKVLAGKIATLLNKNDIDVFLAHQDIEISEEWRKEILNHLKNDNILLALLTPDYEKSVWANQEAGYMMGKGGKNIPLIVGQTEIRERNLGFLESFQGIAVKEENLEDCVEKIIRASLK